MFQRTFLRTVTAVVVLSLLTLTGVATQATAQGRSDEALAHVIAVQEEHTGALMAKPGVVGTAVGANQQGEPVVKVFVVDGADAVNVPRRLNGVPVAVEVTGEIVALARSTVNHAAEFPRPVPIGVSTGHPAITAGTIGARVTKAGNVYALSNNHVYADENRANIGDHVLQPGPFDGGTDPADAIGSLSEYEPIVFSTSASNTIDAAIALSSSADLGNATPSDCYGIPRSATVAPTIGLRVMKCGRTTGLTKGRIYAINATVNVGYDSGVARFVGQIIITPGSFSAGGDSGSLIVGDGGSNDRKAVGLLFAGSSSITVANPIAPVLGRFGVSIDGQ